ncbi:unnamed protein product, partial [Porites evermanni]
DAYSQTPISTTGQRTAEGTVFSSNANNALDRALPTMSWVTSNKRVGISEGGRGNFPAGLATDNINELRCNIHVAFCHPLSHLKRRVIKVDPTHLRTDNTCKFPPWNDGRGALKALGKGLKEKEKGQIKMKEVAPGMGNLSLK